MFLEAIQKPEVMVERLSGNDYFRVVRSDLSGHPITVISGIVHGVTFSFEVPVEVDEERVRALVARVVGGVEENVFLGEHVQPGVDSVGLSGRVGGVTPSARSVLG